MILKILAAMVLSSAIASTDSGAKLEQEPENYFQHRRKAKKDCEGPFGAVRDGTKMKRYRQLVVEKPEICEQEMRVCKDGILSGSFIFPGCTQVTRAKRRSF